MKKWSRLVASFLLIVLRTKILVSVIQEHAFVPFGQAADVVV